MKFFDEFGEVFSNKTGITHVTWNETNTGNTAAVGCKPYG